MKNGVAPYVPKDTLARVIDAQKGKNALRDRAALYLTHYLGIRAKEVAALRVSDVYDPATGIREVIRLLATMTKGEKYREVFLVNATARDALMQYLTTRSLRTPNAPLFMSQKGGAFSANSMQKMLANRYHMAGVKASSHSGRRSFATNLIEAGADIYTIQTMMGHTSISTTQAYFVTSPARLKKFAALL